MHSQRSSNFDIQLTHCQRMTPSKRNRDYAVARQNEGNGKKSHSQIHTNISIILLLLLHTDLLRAFGALLRCKIVSDFEWYTGH